MELDTSGWPNLIGFAGKARSGKDTAALLMQAYGYRRLAFGDKVREALRNLNPPICGSDGAAVLLDTLLKTYTWEQLKGTSFQPHIRTLLQRMGTEVGRAIDSEIWINQLANSIPFEEPLIVIPDVRFQNEADFIRREGGVVIHLDRPSGGETFGTEHSSEAGNFDSDYFLKNDGSILDLHSTLIRALNDISA